MYSKIMMPVDLEHVEQLEKGLRSAADLAKHYHASICYVSVSASAPSPLAHNPEEFTKRLQDFADRQAATHGLSSVSARTLISKDPAVDLDATLLDAIEEAGADLVVMASHIPGFTEYLFSSNAGYVASHAKVSVMVVR